MIYDNAENEIERLNAKIEVLEELLDMHSQVSIEQLGALQDTMRECDTLSIIAQEKSNFLSTMSHEIRTPLHGVVSSIEMLVQTRLDKEQHELVEIARYSSEMLLNIINNVLDNAKLESKQFELKSVHSNIKILVENFIKYFSQRTIKHNIELRHYIPEELNTHFMCDPDRILQLLNNLAGNSLKFTNEGYIQINLSILNETADDCLVHFEIKDTGVGIPEKAKLSMFQPFGVSSESAHKEYHGTGLGLSICKKLVDLMQGEIGFESEEGKGSVFWFDISIKKPEKQFISDIAEKVSILYISDNNTNICNIPAYSVTVCDEKTAMAKLLANPAEVCYKLIIIDSEVNGVNGYLLGNKIKQMVDLPLIMITSKGTHGDLERSKENGFSAYLSYPFSKTDLLNVIDAVLKNSDCYNNSRHANPSWDNTAADCIISKHSIQQEQPITTVNMQTPAGMILPQSITTVNMQTPAGMIQPQSITTVNMQTPAGMIQPQSVKTLKILVAEDNIVNSKLITKIITNMGYTYQHAVNGKACLEQLEKTDFDMILMDMHMPVMNGLEAARHIRSRGINIPIIALTGNAFSEDKAACFDAGMNDFITKPFKKETLENIIAKWGTNVS